MFPLFTVPFALLSLVDKDKKTFLVALAQYLGLIIPHGQSVSDHVLQAKMCFKPVHLGYINDVM